MGNKLVLLLLALLVLPVVCAELLEVKPLLLKNVAKTGVVAQDYVSVKNTGLDTVSVKVSTLDPSFKLSSYVFGLLPDEEAKLDFKFSSKVPGVFVNEFFIRAEDSLVVLPAVIEVETPVVRFDSTVDTSDARRVFYPGDEVFFSFTVFDLLEFAATDVEMGYSVVDMENSLVYHEEETANVKSQKTLARKLKLLDDLKPGAYILVVRSRQGSSIGFSTLLFNVVERPVVVEQPSFKGFCFTLVNNCLGNGVCMGIVASAAFIIFAVLFIYVVEVVKLSRMPRRVVERAIRQEERLKKRFSLAKKVLDEAEEQRKAKEQEKIDETNRKKLIEDMFLKKVEPEQNIAEKKLFERQVNRSIKERKKVIKEKRDEIKRKKKIENMLGGRK
ncbi:MAG: hypothetical protein Q8N77_04210 [Nanoarchaeota archaeon]|nr:hypothetical protein [Nanoarchaeota archaeon]